MGRNSVIAWPQVRKIALFLAVGGAAAATYASACTLLVLWLPAYKFEIGVGVYVAIIPIAFLAQRHATFRSRGPIVRELATYTVLQATSIGASTWLLARLVTDHPLRNLIVFLLIAGVAAILSFLICNLFIFGKAADIAK